GEAAENTEEEIEHGEKLPKAACRVLKRESAEPHSLDGVFDGLDILHVRDARDEGGVNRAVRRLSCGGRLANGRVEQRGDLRRNHLLSEVERDKHTCAPKAFDAGVRLALRDSDDGQRRLFSE